MKVKTSKEVCLYFGQPSPTARQKGTIHAGFSLELSQLTGESIGGNSIWYRDANGDYLHSEGLEPEVPVAVEPSSGKKGPGADYRGLLDFPHELLRTGGRGVRVALLDSGIYLGHPDFKDADPPISAVDASWSDIGSEDGTGHGSCCAGYIKARSKDGSGVTGLAPDCELRVFKVGHELYGFTPTRACEGLRKAIDWKAQVISMSFAIYDLVRPSMDALLSEAAASGAILVASAGDDEFLARGRELFYPATHPSCIAVGAVDEANYRRFKTAGYSARLDYALPDLPLWTCARPIEGLYAQKQGSSIATAIMSALISLVMSGTHPVTGPWNRSSVMSVLDRSCASHTQDYVFGSPRMRIVKTH